MTFANEVLYEFVPRLAVILGEKNYGAENIGVEQGKRVLEMAEVELKSSKRNLKAFKDLNQELEGQLNQLRCSYTATPGQLNPRKLDFGSSVGKLMENSNEGHLR